jgi:hypothetical protein
VLHVEMRFRFQTARAFNLGAEEVETRFLKPLRAGKLFEYEGREWDPRKTKLKVYEAPEMAAHQLGMGRGWQTVEKEGREVTQAMLASGGSGVTQGPRQTAGARPPVTDQLHERLIGRLSAGPVTLPEVIAIATDLMPESDVDERSAVSAQAIWELLREGNAQLSPSDR